MTQDIRVAIIEDIPNLREGLHALIGGTAGFQVSGSFATVESALEGMTRERPAVALSDIGLPGLSGIEGVRRIKALDPSVQVLMLTVYADDDHVFEAICAGASGYLLKDTPPARLLDAIREVASGGAPMTPGIARRVVEMFRHVVPAPGAASRLTDREIEVLGLLADGHSYKTAAAELALSLDTVRFHIRHIYDKLHVHSKSEAVLKAYRTGVLRR